MMTTSLLSYMQPTLKELMANFQVKKLEEREGRKLVSIFLSFGKPWVVADTHLLFAYTYSSAQEQTQL